MSIRNKRKKIRNVLLFCFFTLWMSGCGWQENLPLFADFAAEGAMSRRYSEIEKEMEEFLGEADEEKAYQKEEGEIEEVSGEEKKVSKVGSKENEKTPEEISGEKREQNDSGRSEKQAADLSDAMEEILNDVAKEFTGGYLLDESFLKWLSSEYGDESVFAVREETRQPQSDTESWYRITGESIHVLWEKYCRSTAMPKEYAEKKVYEKECRDEKQVVLDFTGDINLAEGWSTTKYLDKQAGGIRDCISPALMEEMQNADILMINNEFTFSTRGAPVPGKTYTFRANPRRIDVILELGTDILSLANNHVYDYGEEALLDTIDTVEQAQIPYAGAGKNLEEAMKPVYFIANGRKIAIVAATQIERSTNYTREATDSSAGVLKTLNPDKFLSVIEQAEAESDYVIAFVHWGTENTNDYGRDQKELGQLFIDAGADVVIGGHAHCLQGFDFHNGKPIIYSLGNFWFNNRTTDTGIAQVVIHTEDNQIDFRFLPCLQKGCMTSLVEEPEEKQRILDFMQRISASGVSVDAEGYVTEE